MNILKQILAINTLLLPMCLLPTIAKAEGVASPSYEGYYMGLQAGWAEADYTASNQSLDPASTNRTGSTGRAFVGYQLSRHVGLETGYTKYTDVEFKNILSVRAADLEFSQQSVDLLLKLSSPLIGPLSVWAKGGAAYFQSKTNSNKTAKAIPVKESAFNFKGTVPAYGFGLNLDVTHQFSVDLSWNRIQRLANSDVRTTDMVMAGMTLRFFI
ncbi:MAG: outer membrane beta-barrel protein [Gammaproteobacteria bacterium]